MGLARYWEKRNFDVTPEPRGEVVQSGKELAFYIQKHHASRLHYDFRLELDGTLVSWAIPKGPSLNPKEKRLAVHVEDHPISYGTFEGDIPPHQYGAGHVLLWDRGVWEPIGDPQQGYRNGSLKFVLHGFKLSGKWALVRMRDNRKHDEKASEKENWLLIKEQDDAAKSPSEPEITEQRPDSVKRLKGPVRKVAQEPPSFAKSPASAKASEKSMPDNYSPQLATLAVNAPTGDGWLSEVKFDGYRALARVDHHKVKLFSRNGNDWSSKWAGIAEALAGLPVEQAWLDGEVVAIKEDGTISFQDLQNAARFGTQTRLAYFLFDLLYLNGHEITQLPLMNRKELLKDIFTNAGTSDVLFYSEHLENHAREAFNSACQHKMEGIILKRKDAPYEQARTTDWLKLKCVQRQEFVVAGYTDPAGSRQQFGALLLGVYDEIGALGYVGRVGTGFDDDTLVSISKHFRRLHQPASAFSKPPSGQEVKGVHWLKPELVAEVQFGQWTEAGVIRHSSFIALRNDKPPEQIIRETPIDDSISDKAEKPVRNEKPARNKEKQDKKELQGGQGSPLDHESAQGKIAGIRLTHPSKILFSGSGVSKIELARYYQNIEKWILPHLIDRPLSIVRCPDGESHQCFFQKHADPGMNEVIQRISVPDSAGSHNYMLANHLPAIIALVQMGVLELHTWGSSKGHLDKPDRLIFDLDPAEGLKWTFVVEAAQLIRGLLREIGLESMVKTSGGKGLHVVIPITPQHDWSTIKGFTKSIATYMEGKIPDRFTANMSKDRRKNRIFIDYLRNGVGATAIVAYSTRSKPNATVSVPIFWEELDDGVKSDTFTVETLPQRLSALSEDPWEQYWNLKQRITSKMLRTFA